MNLQILQAIAATAPDPLKTFTRTNQWADYQRWGDDQQKAPKALPVVDEIVNKLGVYKLPSMILVTTISSSPKTFEYKTKSSNPLSIIIDYMNDGYLTQPIQTTEDTDIWKGTKTHDIANRVLIQKMSSNPRRLLFYVDLPTLVGTINDLAFLIIACHVDGQTENRNSAWRNLKYLLLTKYQGTYSTLGHNGHTQFRLYDRIFGRIPGAHKWEHIPAEDTLVAPCKQLLKAFYIPGAHDICSPFTINFSRNFDTRRGDNPDFYLQVAAFSMPFVLSILLMRR